MRMNEAMLNEFLSGTIKGIRARTNSKEEFESELKRLFPSAIITKVTNSHNEEGENNEDDKKSDCKEDCNCWACATNKVLRHIEAEANEKSTGLFISHELMVARGQIKWAMAKLTGLAGRL